jgi:hypothetical protein
MRNSCKLLVGKREGKEFGRQMQMTLKWIARQ